jgi:hypothetical protein
MRAALAQSCHGPGTKRDTPPPGAGASEPSRATRRNSLGFTPAWSRKKRVKCGGALHLEADHGLLDAERSQYRRSLRASLAGKPTTTVAHSRLGTMHVSLEKMTAFPDSTLGGARSADRAKADSPAGAADCRRADFTRILAPYGNIASRESRWGVAASGAWSAASVLSSRWWFENGYSRWMTPPSVITPRSANKLKKAKQLSGTASASNKSRFMTTNESISGFAAQPNSSPS